MPGALGISRVDHEKLAGALGIQVVRKFCAIWFFFADIWVLDRSGTARRTPTETSLFGTSKSRMKSPIEKGKTSLLYVHPCYAEYWLMQPFFSPPQNVLPYGVPAFVILRLL